MEISLIKAIIFQAPCVSKNRKVQNFSLWGRWNSWVGSLYQLLSRFKHFFPAGCCNVLIMSAKTLSVPTLRVPLYLWGQVKSSQFQNIWTKEELYRTGHLLYKTTIQQYKAVTQWQAGSCLVLDCTATDLSPVLAYCPV